LNPQQPDAQSASDSQGPVMNWEPVPVDVEVLPLPLPVLPLPLLSLVLVLLFELLVSELDPDELPVELELIPPVNPIALAASSFGVPDPNPQPPSRDNAMMAPAHLPVLNAQQPDAQSASLVHWPVMNWAPLPRPTFWEPGMDWSMLVSLEPEPELSVEEEPVLSIAGEVGAGPVKPRATAALSLGWASPKPQPPSRSVVVR
jgi:hypothetical protein